MASLGWTRWGSLCLSLALCACGAEPETPEGPVVQRARPQVLAAGRGELVPVRFRAMRPGEKRLTLLAQQVEQTARWDADRRVANSLKYVFEAEREEVAVTGSETIEARYTIASMDGGAGPQRLEGATVVVRSAGDDVSVLVNGTAATEEERAVLAAMVAYEGVARDASSVMPSGGRARLDQSWTPDAVGLSRLLGRLGAKVDPETLHATSRFEEVQPCDAGTCAHVATELRASVGATATVEGQLHVWTLMEKDEPARKLAWRIALTETRDGGNTPFERTVTQMQDSVVLPAGEGPSTGDTPR